MSTLKCNSLYFLFLGQTITWMLFIHFCHDWTLISLMEPKLHTF
jgi:hypothetical protein